MFPFVQYIKVYYGNKIHLFSIQGFRFNQFKCTKIHNKFHYVHKTKQIQNENAVFENLV